MHIYHAVLPAYICSHCCVFHLSYVVTIPTPNTSRCQLILPRAAPGIIPVLISIQELSLARSSSAQPCPPNYGCGHNLSVSLLQVIKPPNHLHALGQFSGEAAEVWIPLCLSSPRLDRIFAMQFTKRNFSEKSFQENPSSEWLLWTFKMLFIIDEYSNNRFISMFSVLGNGISATPAAHVPPALLPWVCKGRKIFFWTGASSLIIL